MDQNNVRRPGLDLALTPPRLQKRSRDGGSSNQDDLGLHTAYLLIVQFFSRTRDHLGKKQINNTVPMVCLLVLRGGPLFVSERTSAFDSNHPTPQVVPWLAFVGDLEVPGGDVQHGFNTLPGSLMVSDGMVFRYDRLPLPRGGELTPLPGWFQGVLLLFNC